MLPCPHPGGLSALWLYNYTEHYCDGVSDAPCSQAYRDWCCNGTQCTPATDACSVRRRCRRRRARPASTRLIAGATRTGDMDSEPGDRRGAAHSADCDEGCHRQPVLHLAEERAILLLHRPLQRQRAVLGGAGPAGGAARPLLSPNAMSSPQNPPCSARRYALLDRAQGDGSYHTYQVKWDPVASTAAFAIDGKTYATLSGKEVCVCE